ncbi:hypothetical protein [Leclercia sp.]|uniref:hypothetical protein n=1 Tax=Leclercia sp. TaxID=1898428 RepID=UPI002FDCAA17
MDNPLLLKGLVVLLFALWIWDLLKPKRKKQPADPAIAQADARERHAWRDVRWGFLVIKIACALYFVQMLTQFLLT